ncbi:MAG TPA: TRAP transporter large permease subunit, partial [Rhabdaerophilum sp.]|nr:TRAP transporter large permease subunit [Rhabdaerophilum sp.]
IRGGIFTPSEVGAFAVVYAAVVGVLFHRELTWEKLVEALGEGVLDVGVIMLIILLSGMVGYALIFEQAPQNIAEAMLGLSKNPLVIVFLILAFLFVAGLFVEATVLVLLLTPIFVPIIKDLGIDEVHFGILMMSIVTFGGMTPPVGVAMYTVCSILDTPIEEYFVESLPFVAAILAVVAFLAFMPGLVLWLPNLLM